MTRRKLELAERLRCETTLSIKAIAARVRFGSSKSANATLHRHMRQSSVNDPAQEQLGIERLEHV
jgi:AraC-like DNA-binding protein